MVVNPQESELWVPQGVTHSATHIVGRNAETGELIYEYRFQVYDEVTGRKHEFRVLVDDTTSKAHIEEMVGNAMESWLVEVRRKHMQGSGVKAVIIKFITPAPSFKGHNNDYRRNY